MLALVGTVLSRSASRKVLFTDGDGVLGTHRRRTASSRARAAVLRDVDPEVIEE